MKNSEKIDINLEADSTVNEEELTEEQRCQEYYETALRYINIAKYMKQYEDQDKYYHRALKNLKRARTGMPGLKPMIKDIVHKKYYARAQGKISLYEEACRIRDNARTPTDYLSAQTLFDRIHKYETLHAIPEKYVSKDLYEQVGKCADSEQQSIHCGELANQLVAKQKRKSLISSSAIILIIVAILAFTRTTVSRLLLANVYGMAGHYDKAYQYYDYVYQKTNVADYFEQYKKYRYLSAKAGYETQNREDVRNSFRELARLNYKDSEEYLVKMEKARIAELGDGEKIRFGEVNWRILAHDGDKALLIKDKTVGNAPFQINGGEADWESSSIRAWLNNTYINELFSFDLEKEAIIDTAVLSSGNSVYGTKGGKDTKDKLFLLSEEEFIKYADILPKTRNLWWLRTPGNSPSTMSFVSTDKTIMSYGYDTGNDNIKARPAIWVNTSDN